MTHTTELASPSDPKLMPFGSRLQSARETLGLERCDAAQQLRLNEKIIIMMEKDKYPPDLPVTFIRGYLRAYGKLLQIPEHEIKLAIEPIKQKPTTLGPLPTLSSVSLTKTSNYFMRLLTSIIVLTLIGLAVAWWYTHSALPSLISENPLALLPSLNINKQESEETHATQAQSLKAASSNQESDNITTNTNPASTIAQEAQTKEVDAD